MASPQHADRADASAGDIGVYFRLRRVIDFITRHPIRPQGSFLRDRQWTKELSGRTVPAGGRACLICKSRPQTAAPEERHDLTATGPFWLAVNSGMDAVSCHGSLFPHGQSRRRRVLRLRRRRQLSRRVAQRDGAGSRCSHIRPAPQCPTEAGCHHGRRCRGLLASRCRR